MTSDRSEAWFDNLRSVVAGTLASSPPVDFRVFLRSIPGLAPELAAQILVDLAKTAGLTEAATWLLESAAVPVSSIVDPLEQLLPPPHPLDYEWRFDPTTRRQLASRILATIGCRGHTLLLGCPTIAHELLRSTETPRITLVDSNPALPRLTDATSYIRYETDLRVGLPEQIGPSADLCVADPPFYLEQIEAFIEAASQGVRAGGDVLLTLPPPATRPSAASDVRRAMEIAGRCHLHLRTHEPGAITYLRPRFEREAHRALGLHGIPDDWRIADLFVFERDERPSVHRRTTTRLTPRWSEVTIDQTRIRVRLDSGSDEGGVCPGEDLLQYIVPGGVLDSVSSRDPRRHLANVWTDGNVVWRTPRPFLLLAILRAVAHDGDPYRAAADHLSSTGGDLDPARIKPLTAAVLAQIRSLD